MKPETLRIELPADLAYQLPAILRQLSYQVEAAAARAHRTPGPLILRISFTQQLPKRRKGKAGPWKFNDPAA